MAFTPLSLNISPNYTPNYLTHQMGRTIQATACAAPLTLDVIQRGMGGGLLNASRTPIDHTRLGGLRSDEPVFLIGQRNIPQTGYSWLDRGADRVLDAADYIPQATEDAMTNSLKWGLGVAAGVSAFTGLSMLGLHSVKLNSTRMLEPATKMMRAAVIIGYGAVAGVFASLCAFSYSFFQNFRDYHRHMAKNSLEPKGKPH